MLQTGNNESLKKHQHSNQQKYVHLRAKNATCSIYFDQCSIVLHPANYTEVLPLKKAIDSLLLWNALVI